MTENCDDYDGYKKGKLEFSSKCGEAFWPAEDEIKKGYHCYDEAHSKARCITEKYRDKIEKELLAKIDEGDKPLCKDVKLGVLECVQHEKSIAKCFREIEYFKECLDESVRDVYSENCERNKISTI